MSQNPKATHAATLRVTIAEPLIVGPIDGRVRAVVPITGGTITGKINGEVLPGGFDWAWLYDDGQAKVEAHYVLKLDDGSFATIVNVGTCKPVAGQSETFSGQAVPRFETASTTYSWINDAQFVCRFTSRMADGYVDLELFIVE
ncbi:DUF3237 domain-containing protein [Rhodobacter sp. NTK016B]|uniref:DUF3237 domain-containing protein n=1 Tax=Rhodobacter sp. NTK016B TaxID=2759676 RepID=UPI001A8FF43A|nr:DUF3237 domain-containing protein [Rhodobacter sp. NTK016B]MBN8294844.1 DUF3237 domain-containing protein [Rhodobacter sp. NTK016B]